MAQTFHAWRISAYDTPVRTIPSRRAGRFNTAADPPTQYFCLHPWGPWAEVLRWEDRREAPEAAALATRVWALRVTVNGPVERVGFDTAEDFDLSPEELVAEDHAPCQALARRARARGVASLVVPSAALPGTDNLVVLGPRVMTAWLLDPVSDVDVPASVVADRAGAPLAALSHVRWRDTAHAGLQAWRAGATPALREAVPTAMTTPTASR